MTLEDANKKVSNLYDNETINIDDIYTLISWVDANYFNKEFAKQNNLSIRELELKLDIFVENIKKAIDELFNVPIILKPSKLAQNSEYKNDEVVLYVPQWYSLEELEKYIQDKLLTRAEYRQYKIDLENRYIEETEYYRLYVYRLLERRE